MGSFRKGQDEISTRKALQTVAAGQKAENLLDFDDASGEDGQPSGLAATTLTSTPAAANLLAGTSSNPLDDLVSIFSGTNLGGGSGGAMTNGSHVGMQSPVQSSPAPAFGLTSPPPSGVTSPTQDQKPQDDLLGLF